MAPMFYGFRRFLLDTTIWVWSMRKFCGSLPTIPVVMTEVYCNFTFNVQNYRNDSKNIE